MSLVGTLAAFLVVLVLSAMYSGCETGIYTVSRLRLEVEVRAGRRWARWLQRLLRDDGALLVTLLVGNNLMIELATHLAQDRIRAVAPVAPWVQDLLVTLLLTPIVFLFAELLPKDLFRRSPLGLLRICVGPVSLSRLIFLPVVLPLVFLATSLERLFRLRSSDLNRALGREEVLELLREGTTEGELEPHAEELARNVLALRATTVMAVCIPWERVEAVDLDAGAERVRRAVEICEHSRLPARGAAPEGGGTRVVGYLHQLDVMGRPEADPGQFLRPLPSLEPDAPVDRALARMRNTGQRVALVGTPEAPLGLVAVADLIAVIAGERVA